MSALIKLSKEVISIGFCLFLSFIFTTNIAICEETRFIKLNQRGNLTSITLSEADANLKKLVFYTSYSGNTTDRFELNLTSGFSTVGRLSYKAIPFRMPLDIAAKNSLGWINLPVKIGDNYRDSFKVVARSYDPEDPTVDETRDPYCGCLTETEIEVQMKYFSEWMQFTSREEFCAIMMDGEASPMDCSFIYDGPSLPPISKDVYGIGTIQKNTCDSRFKYIVKAEFDLSQMRESDLKRGTTLSVGLKFSKHQGDKAAILKPTSDGGVFPGEALLLMAKLAYGYGEELRLVYWNGSKIVRQVELTRRDLVDVSGHSFHRAVITPFLKGGKATAELVSPDSADAYSICLKLVRSRQNFGGYRR
ncbi:MAG: hypothetical protein GYA55_06415 [SAR324 cluster bacterium]|uniref:Uncharacterized protein n=1 Tax=SAR324 cluster bacterium TaxID=2024889 RepID=A0A7X9FRZ7_9DELT|nr:hypothetical protein [SAR324 cluster bacterium]